ncbi:hypothetical protein HMPREF9296_1788 [Prevotella disiens FB035-09AN]|uniref:Uncharacterized protein n=1 Tax=Prevotella disiens FB035-09AN TaxID=866771 RepID=E1KTH9_9BACT|nr:hypothetical protein HMPREF9296_1788 [Prevotella disiens FB035-09AN]
MFLGYFFKINNHNVIIYYLCKYKKKGGNSKKSTAQLFILYDLFLQITA